MLGSLKRLHDLSLTSLAFHLQDWLLGCLCLLSEDGLCLTTKTFLFYTVSAVTLTNWVLLTLLVQGYLEFVVAIALRAVSPAGLWDIHHSMVGNSSIKF